MRPDAPSLSARVLAQAVLESHAAAYWATEPTQHVARAKVVESAARALDPLLAEILSAHAKAVCTSNPS